MVVWPDERGRQKAGGVNNTGAGTATATVRLLRRLRIRGRPRHAGCSSPAHTAPLCCIGANAGGRLRRRSLAGVMVGHPAGLCDGDLASLRPGIGRGPHGRRAGLHRASGSGHLWSISGRRGTRPMLLRCSPPSRSRPVSAREPPLQALVGAALVRRWVGFPSPLTRARDIGTFLLLGGPLSCLVSATVGVTTLAVSGQIPWSLFVMTWWTWWVGDTLGVLIATPLVLSWLAEPRAIWHRRRLSVGLPLVVALALQLRRLRVWARPGTGAPAPPLRAAGGEPGACHTDAPRRLRGCTPCLREFLCQCP